jgi:hypothetical protein
MRYRLRTLLIVLAMGPLVLAGCYFGLREVKAPAWAVVLGAAQVVFWIAVLAYILRRGLLPSQSRVHEQERNAPSGGRGAFRPQADSCTLRGFDSPSRVHER